MRVITAFLSALLLAPSGLIVSATSASANLITYEFSGTVGLGTFSLGTMTLPPGIQTNGTTIVEGSLAYDPSQGASTVPCCGTAPTGFLYFPNPSSVDFQLYIAGLEWAANGADDTDSGITLPVPATATSIFGFSSGKPTSFPYAPEDHNVLQIVINPTLSWFELQWYDLAPSSGNILGAYVIEGVFNEVTVSEEPEPATLALLVAGFLGLGALRRRKARKTA